MKNKDGGDDLFDRLNVSEMLQYSIIDCMLHINVVMIINNNNVVIVVVVIVVIIVVIQTSVLNKHLSELMPGLTAKVFRTYNASKTLQEQLEELTNRKDTILTTHTLYTHRVSINFLFHFYS